MKTLSVIVPVYFNEGSLPLLFRELCGVEKALQGKGIALEMIFVDDGSLDGSWGELLKIRQQRQNTRIIRLTRNFGSIRASKAGCRFVTGDCFTILSADLQDPPKLILDMAERWLGGSKYVICVRASRQDPLTTRIFSALYYWLVRAFVIGDYPPGGYDLTLMDRALLPYFQDGSKNLFTPLLGFWLGYKPEVLYYDRCKRVHGKSRWTFFKKLNALLDSILGYSVAPLRLISFIGIVVSLCSFSYGGWIIANALLGRMEVPGFATIVVLLSFLMGVVITSLSVIGEYLWRIFDEVNKRPEVVIDEMHEP
jgi:glycosyltransferase involved in cell wall biosynthesis